MTTPEPIYYQVHLGADAPQGGHVICHWLGWCGANDGLAKVRILQSTTRTYRSGMIGLVRRERLIAIDEPRCGAPRARDREAQAASWGAAGAAYGRLTAENLRARCALPIGVSVPAALQLVTEQARRRAVPYPAYLAAHGLLRALASEQTTRAARLWLKTLSPDALLELVAEVAAMCVTIDAVPSYLNTRSETTKGAAA